MWWKTDRSVPSSSRLSLSFSLFIHRCISSYWLLSQWLILGILLGWGVTHGRQKGSANRWWCPFGSSGEHMLQHWCRNTHSLLHGCSHRCPPGSSYRTMWHLPTEHQTPLNTVYILTLCECCFLWSAYHRVADLEHFTEQNPTLSFCKGFSKRIQIAGVPYIRTVHTLMGHSHTNRHIQCKEFD